METIIVPIKWHENNPFYWAIPIVYTSDAQSAQKASIDSSFVVREEDIIPLDKMVAGISPTYPTYYPGMDNKTGVRLNLGA